jgi:hypothetical protein
LAKIMNRMVSIVLRDAHERGNALEAECWASEVVSTWSTRKLPNEEVFVSDFVRALERKASPKALATLRALGAVGT